MDWKARIRSTLAAAPQIPDDDVLEELAQHAKAMYESARADGCSPEEADRRVAGQLDRWTLDASALRRTARRAPAPPPPPAIPSSRFTGFAQEIRHAARMLARSPGFTAVAAISLALGIGINSALFSFHDAILLRPLPVPDPAAVVTVSAAAPDDPAFLGRLSYPNYGDLRDHAQSFDGLVAFQLNLFSVARSREATRDMRMSMLVSNNFFQTLGLQPALGRWFTKEEGVAPGRDAVVVLSHDFWTKGLGGDPGVLNSVVLINGIDFTVIGVAPSTFSGMDVFVRPNLFVPSAMAPRLIAGPDNPLENREARSWDVRGRLKPGVARQTAEAEMTTLWNGLQRQYPDANRNRVIAVRTELQQRVRANPANALITALMTALAAIVLVIACANIANLLLGRTRARSREIAIRVALGVSRLRLLRQLLTESLLLALLGGGLGIAVAYGGIRFFSSTAQNLVPIDLSVAIEPVLDRRVLTFSLLASLLSALLFGLAPAWQSLKTELIPALKSTELAETGRRRTIGRNVLVVAQVALSMVLLVATGMLQDGFRKNLSLDPGFRTDRLITMALDTSFARYTPQQSHDFYRDLVERARTLPGVVSVTLADSLPLDRGFGSRAAVVPDGYRFPQGQQSLSMPSSIVDEHYFATMRTPLVRGRAFTAADRDGSLPVAIVNETFAATFWPNQDPIGKRVQIVDQQGMWREVVGLTKTEKYATIVEPPTPFVYVPFAQRERPQMVLIVESSAADAAALASPLRELVRAIDVNQPVFSVRTFQSAFDQQAAGPLQLVTRVASAMGLMGLTLALVGLYGLVAYSVTRRTREIGIRMAIGAGRADVLKMILGQGMLLAGAGIVTGGIASVAVARLLTTGMAGLGTPNTATYVVVPILLVGLTLVASYIPARRASKVDPLRALRYE